jgi:hypothetical protein
LYISGCSNYGKADEYIIAIVKLDTDKEVLKTIRKAWKIDIKRGIFTPIDTKNIKSGKLIFYAAIASPSLGTIIQLIGLAS